MQGGTRTMTLNSLATVHENLPCSKIRCTGRIHLKQYTACCDSTDILLECTDAVLPQTVKEMNWPQWQARDMLLLKPRPAILSSLSQNMSKPPLMVELRRVLAMSTAQDRGKSKRTAFGLKVKGIVGSLDVHPKFRGQGAQCMQRLLRQQHECDSAKSDTRFLRRHSSPSPRSMKCD